MILRSFLLLLLCSASACGAPPASQSTPKPGFTFVADTPLAQEIAETTALESEVPQGNIKVQLRKGSANQTLNNTITYTDEMAIVQAVRRLKAPRPRQEQVPFRAVMIDVARRYHSISTLKTLARACSEADIPYLQLHLTDDQNWMLPSKIIPGVDSRNTHQKPAYTPAELQELTRFARLRGVHLIPEVDMPGHNRLLVRHRPEMKLAGTSNVIDFTNADVRKTFRALISETCELFPSAPYFHLGGDEVDHGGRETGYVDFLAEMAREVLKNGKKPIVWEGFGASDHARRIIPKETLVVAWEGPYYPASKLIDDGFQTINAGWDPYYVVNHYPYESFTLVPVERILKHNPNRFGVVDWAGPRDRSFNFPKSENLKGSLMCWWEGHEWNTARILPARILAMGDRLAAKGPLSYQDWKTRLATVQSKIDQLAHPFEVDCPTPQFEGSVTVTLKPRKPGLKLAWRTDGQLPTRNDDEKFNSITIRESCVLSVLAFDAKGPVGEVKWLPLHKVKRVPNLAMGAKVQINGEDDPHFSASLVTDGVADVVSSFWLAYPSPQTLRIDLGTVQTISRVEVVAFWMAGGTARYRLSSSADGKTWKEVVNAIYQDTPATPEGYRHSFSPTQARYVRFETRLSEGFPPRISRIHEIRVF